MFQRFPIRRKLVTALAVPLVALLVVAVFEALKTRGDAAEIRRQADLATATLGPGSLSSNLEDERNASAIYLLDMTDTVDLRNEDLEEQAFPATDESLATLEQEITDTGGRVAEVYGPVVERLGSLNDLRTQVTGFSGQRGVANARVASEIFDGYTELMEELFAANRKVALEVDDPELRRGAQLIDLGARQSDLQARLVIGQVLAAGSNDGINTTDEITRLASDLSELQENATAIESKGVGDYQPIVSTLLGTEHVQQFPEIIDRSLETGLADVPGTLNAAAGPSREENGYSVFRRALEAELTSEADSMTSAAELRAWLFWGLALGVVLTALAATWLVSRSITRPLRSLTNQATEMAERKLPEAVMDILDTPLGDDVAVPDVDPITVQTRDEVADVADALNTVQDSALDLAVEQAVLRRNIADSFVNLGRRNQNLLGRQLDFITELEHNETDPDTLANLFRLDHLATRMRRNAESLLVLAGIDPPRKWAAPVRITDAIRAALGEVEDYQRVTVRAVEPTTILGSAAADLAHLMAELIENALIFSPPDQSVEIRGRVGGSPIPHQAGVPAQHGQPGYTLAVIDSGLGMPPEELDRANRRLAGAESFTIAPSKYLGHYVAGNLAARHNIKVELHNSPGHGITAIIQLPSPLLTSDAPAFPAAPPASPPAPVAPLGAPYGDGAGAPGLPAAPQQPEPAMLGQGPGGGGADQPSWLTAFSPAAPAPDGQPDRLPPGGSQDVPLPAPAADLQPLEPLPPLGDPAGPAGPPPSPFAPAASAPPFGAAPPPTDPAPPPAPAPTGWQGAPSDGGLSAPTPPPLSAPHLQVAPGQQAPGGPAAPPPGPLPRRETAGSRPGAMTERTSGGLAKRSPQQIPGRGPSPAVRPSEDLLQTLATYTTHLHRQIDPSRPPTPPSGGPGATLPPFNPTPASGVPPVRPGFPPAPRRDPAPLGEHGTPTTHSAAPDHTPSGLARRVRGAQLPQTQPIVLHRHSGEVPAVRVSRQAVAPANGPQAGANQGQDHRGGQRDAPRADDVTSSDANAQGRSAKDVYSFLSSFSAGVQRGLDEAHRSSTTSEEDQ